MCEHNFETVQCMIDELDYGACKHVSGHCEECGYATQYRKRMWA